VKATLNRRTDILNAALFAALFLVFLPTWLWLGEAWLSDPYYSHGPLVLILSLYLTWTQRTVCAHIPNAPGRVGWLMILVALGIHLWATLWRAYYISALMIPLALLGLAITQVGWRRTRPILFPVLFLILMVPLPLAEQVGPTLGGWTASGATAIAQWLGVAASHDGSQVVLPNSAFTVGIPCGGLHSAIAIITLATLLAFIVRGRNPARVVLLLAAIPIALAANTLRIALLFVIANLWGDQVAMTYFHDISSPVLFAVAFALLLLTVKVLRCSGVRWQVVFPQ
jgi:exosortase